MDSGPGNWIEVSVSNQRSVRKASSRNQSRFKMPKIAFTGKTAKNTRGPAKKIMTKA